MRVLLYLPYVPSEGPTVFTLSAKHVDSNKNHVGSNFGQRKNRAA